MSAEPPDAPRPRGVLCLGEALVDLICERPVASLAEVDAFVPHFGGLVANVAVLAARAGARIAIAGGVGDDVWGSWLREQLAHAGVDVGGFVTVAGSTTRIALVTVDPDGEATYTVCGDPTGVLVGAVGGSLEGAVERSGALLLSSDTLVDDDERELTMRARELALAAGRPVVFDPSVRLRRWRSRADAAASANACVPDALLVRLDLDEARLMTGEDEPERVAAALLKAGARNVVLTLGGAGALLRGRLRRDAPPAPAVGSVSSVGTGAAVTAALLARLEASDFYEPVIAAGLDDALAAGAAARRRWGAVD